MSERPIVDIEYSTGNLNLDRVRTGVLQRKEELERMGYRCNWSKDLDLDNLPKTRFDELATGYHRLGEELITSFDRNGLPFVIVVFPKTRRAKIHGDNQVYLDQIEATRKEFAQFRDLTGITLEPRITSKPY